MRLHRVSEHLRKQAWTAIAIDFLITVFGVFIGLQVANWNAARIDREHAHTYLERIHADLEADVRTYRDRLEFWNRVSNYGRAGLTYAETGAKGANSNWDLLLAYFQASQVGEFHSISATYDELRSAGALNLISDLRLRNLLANYYTNADNPTLGERPAYRMHVRGIIPIDVQTYIWSHCYATDSSGSGQDLRSCASPISDARAAQIIAAIGHDAALMAELRYWISTLQVAALLAEAGRSSAQRILTTIEADLRR